MNDMKKLSEYKEFFYRDRSLEEFLADEKWSQFYIDELHWLTTQDDGVKFRAETILNKSAFWCAWFLSPVSLLEVDNFCRKIDLTFPSPAYSDALVLSLTSRLIARLKNPTVRAKQVRDLIRNILAGGRGVVKTEEDPQPLFEMKDLMLHPDFEALEQKDEAWWKEATDNYSADRIRDIHALYESFTDRMFLIDKFIDMSPGETDLSFLPQLSDEPLSDQTRKDIWKSLEEKLPAEAKVEAVEAKKEVPLKMQTPEKETNFKSYILIKEKRDEIYDKIVELLEGKNKPKDIMMVLIGAHEAGVFNLKGCTHPTFEKTFPGKIKKNSYNDWSGKLDTNQYKTKYRSNYQNYKDIFVEFKD